ncbi:hypothetical protein KIPB_008724 [Kipferlia bialata]|uniref:Uncharacterized protein n=1 Tax=Kipferlia bialata TaxID=797122 RepID=A0A9K3GLJ6_9EUKA|nr:hypothetical protein KIPB_008724 [Kipferlia bialata]|eukprot:g8724.t1
MIWALDTVSLGERYIGSLSPFGSPDNVPPGYPGRDPAGFIDPPPPLAESLSEPEIVVPQDEITQLGLAECLYKGCVGTENLLVSLRFDGVAHYPDDSLLWAVPGDELPMQRGVAKWKARRDAREALEEQEAAESGHNDFINM